MGSGLVVVVGEWCVAFHRRGNWAAVGRWWVVGGEWWAAVGLASGLEVRGGGRWASGGRCAHARAPGFTAHLSVLGGGWWAVGGWWVMGEAPTDGRQSSQRTCLCCEAAAVAIKGAESESCSCPTELSSLRCLCTGMLMTNTLLVSAGPRYEDCVCRDS